MAAWAAPRLYGKHAGNLLQVNTWSARERERKCVCVCAARAAALRTLSLLATRETEERSGGEGVSRELDGVRVRGPLHLFTHCEAQ